MHFQKKKTKLKKLEFVEGMKNEGCRRPTFTIKIFAIMHFQKKKKKIEKLEFVKGMKNEGGRRPTFTIKVYPFLSVQGAAIPTTPIW